MLLWAIVHANRQGNRQGDIELELNSFIIVTQTYSHLH